MVAANHRGATPLRWFRSVSCTVFVKSQCCNKHYTICVVQYFEINLQTWSSENQCTMLRKAKRDLWAADGGYAICTLHTSLKSAGLVPGNEPWSTRQASSRHNGMVTWSLITLVGFHQSRECFTFQRDIILRWQWMVKISMCFPVHCTFNETLTVPVLWRLQRRRPRLTALLSFTLQRCYSVVAVDG